jgi:hypothetical protein
VYINLYDVLQNSVIGCFAANQQDVTAMLDHLEMVLAEVGYSA